MRFDHTDLRLFLLIFEMRSITGGAARAHLSLAAASARLRALEASLGTALFVRGSRGVEATPAGETLAHHARLVMEQVERMDADLADHAQGRTVTIRLWTNTAALSEFLPPSLGGFLRRMPHVRIDLHERRSSETIAAVLAGVVDVGIVSDALDYGVLQVLPFATDELVLVAAADHPLRRRRRMTLCEALDHAFIGLGDGSALSAYLDEKVLLTGKAMQVRARVRTFESICCLVEQGAGVAIVPASAARRYRGVRALHTVPLAHAWARRRLLLCMRERTALRRPERLLVGHLAAIASS
ncbi:MAG: LysR substrate-binding domain-containing protein [Janthinobacterium lividum]